MVSLDLEPGVEEWKAQMNPLSYDGDVTLMTFKFLIDLHFFPNGFRDSCKLLFGKLYFFYLFINN